MNKKRILFLCVLLHQMPLLQAAQPSAQYNWYKIGTCAFGAVTVLSACRALKPARMSKETKAQASKILTAIRYERDFIKKIMDSKEIEKVPEERSDESSRWNSTMLRWWDKFDSLFKTSLSCNVVSSNRYQTLRQKVLNYYMSNDRTQINETRSDLQEELDKAYDALCKAYQEKQEFFGKPQQRSLWRFIIPGFAGAATLTCALQAYRR